MIDTTNNPPTTVGPRCFLGMLFISLGVGVATNSVVDAASAAVVSTGIFFIVRSAVYGN